LLEAQAEVVAPELLAVDYNTANGAATVTWRAQPGHDYTVEFSEDLVEWGSFPEVITAGESIVRYTEAEAHAEGETRFYRVRERP
jgi:hypothetical protein